jgi:hypothetical protein
MELRDVVYLHFFGRTVCLLGTALIKMCHYPPSRYRAACGPIGHTSLSTVSDNHH